MGAKPSKAAHHRDPSLETTSIPSSVQTTTSPTINIDGRIYHNIESSSYYLPRDEEEQDRLNSVCYFISNPCLSFSLSLYPLPVIQTFYRNTLLSKPSFQGALSPSQSSHIPPITTINTNSNSMALHHVATSCRTSNNDCPRMRTYLTLAVVQAHGLW